MVASLFGTDPDDPGALEAAIKADPQAALKLRELELQNKLELQKLVVENARIESEERLTTIREVNATMRSESTSEHWPQYSWRPFNGFCFPVAVMAVYFVLPLAGCPVPSVPDWVWIFWGSILGVATWDRGKQKRIQAGGGTQAGFGDRRGIRHPGVTSNARSHRHGPGNGGRIHTPGHSGGKAQAQNPGVGNMPGLRGRNSPGQAAGRPRGANAALTANRNTNGSINPTEAKWT